MIYFLNMILSNDSKDMGESDDQTDASGNHSDDGSNSPKNSNSSSSEIV